MMNQTLEKLNAMRLTVMEQECRRQLELPAMGSLSFEERLSMLVDAEWLSRQNKKLCRLLKAANLRTPEACLEDMDYAASRKLEKAQIARLSDLSWIGEGRNLFITGACGTGKTWLASAFGNAACRQGLKVQSLRVNRLLGDLLAARNSGTWTKLLASLKKPNLLILDDFGLSPLDPLHCRDLLEIVDDRYGHGSILVTAQLPVSGWHGVFEDPTIADAVLDRLVHNAHRIALHGPSMRLKPLQDGVMEGVGAAANP
jgi:DNA replication protein DnaC